METGDLKNNLGKLLKLVRQMKLTTEDGSVPKLVRFWDYCSPCSHVMYLLLKSAILFSSIGARRVFNTLSDLM